MDEMQALISLGTTITTSGALLLAWMLSRKDTDKERERADRYEAVIVRLLEITTTQLKAGSGGGI